MSGTNEGATSCRTTVERRLQRRYPAAVGEATLIRQSASRDEYIASGKVVNVSAEGMALSLRDPIPVGQTVGVRMNGTVYKAVIRRCREEGRGFLAGVHVPLP